MPNTLPFLLLTLPTILLGTALTGRAGPRATKAFLLAASLALYAWNAPASLPILLLSVTANILLTRAIAAATTHRTRITILGVTANLALLAWFKYAAPLLGLSETLPLGISFFTFVQIGLLLAQSVSDQPAPSPTTQALFVTFFPTVTSGPILNPTETLPQFSRTDQWRLTTQNLAVGAGFFLIGLLKKSLLADPLGSLVAQNFAHAPALTLQSAWWTAGAWSMQLYFDFSGYTDMAIGLGWILGVRLPDNFDQPYKARCVIDYWQRWHMSLTRFLMTNVHAPLTMAVLRRRRRRGHRIDDAARRTPTGFLTMMVGPIVTTMLLIGVWHGPRWTYVLFGLLHAGFLLVNHAWRLWKGPTLPPLLSIGLTYLAVLVGAVLFRAETPTQAVHLLAGMLGAHGVSAAPDPRAILNALWLAGLYAIVWGAPTTRQIMQADPRSWLRWAPTPRWAAAMGCALTLGLLAAGGTGEFVYFRF